MRFFSRPDEWKRAPSDSGGWMSKRLDPAIIFLIAGFLGLVPGAAAQEAQQAAQPAAQEAQQRPTIERVDVRGNRRIPEDTIRFYIQSHAGDVYDEARLELDLRALFKANFFESVEVQERDGDT